MTKELMRFSLLDVDKVIEALIFFTAIQFSSFVLDRLPAFFLSVCLFFPFILFVSHSFRLSHYQIISTELYRQNRLSELLDG